VLLKCGIVLSLFLVLSEMFWSVSHLSAFTFLGEKYAGRGERIAVLSNVVLECSMRFCSIKHPSHNDGSARMAFCEAFQQANILAPEVKAPQMSRVFELSCHLFFERCNLLWK